MKNWNRLMSFSVAAFEDMLQGSRKEIEQLFKSGTCTCTYIYPNHRLWLSHTKTFFNRVTLFFRV